MASSDKIKRFDKRVPLDDPRIGQPVINTQTGFLHVFPCPSINPPNKIVSNWVMFSTIERAKEYAKKTGLKIKPCVCAMEAYYVNNR